MGLLRWMGSLAIAVAGLIGLVLASVDWAMRGAEAVLRRRRSTRCLVLPFYRRAVRGFGKRVTAGLEITHAVQRRDVEAVLRRKWIGRLVLVPAYRRICHRWVARG